MTKKLDNVRKCFAEDGYAVVRDVLDDTLVNEAREHIDHLREVYPNKDIEDPTTYPDPFTARHPFQARLSIDERIVEIGKQIFGDSLTRLPSVFFVKKPNNNHKTKWHQDGAYWTRHLEPLKVATIWIALDKVTPENGCLRFIPGSHKKGYLSHDISGVVDDKDGEDPEVDLEEKGYSENDAVDIELEPGDVSVHRPSLLHAAYPNTSDRWRRAYAVRFTSTDTVMKKSTGEQRTDCYLVSGTPGENQQYQWFPYYDPDKSSHMKFHDWREYNKKAKKLNQSLTRDSTFTGN
jgi:ectoine hydroxylase-related dioxygenase (phytanoyl-CoA dioxygenase family)